MAPARLPPLRRLDDAAPHARLLSNGSLSMLVSGAGSGYSWRRDTAVTSFDADRTLDGLGQYVYLCDRERGALWSAGLQPTGARGAAYAASSKPGQFAIRRRDHAIETRFEVAVGPERDVILRRLWLTNRSSVARTIEVTTYAEVVLFPLAAQRSHPAFAKLFVQTEHLAPGMVLAGRRPRGAGEPTTWLAETLLGDGDLELETDRARFLGRGGTLAAPAALRSRAPLSGTVGNVLDPVIALRRRVALGAGERAWLIWISALGDDREEALARVQEETMARSAMLFAAAAERERGLRARLDLSDVDAERLQEIAGAFLYRAPHAGLPVSAEKARAYWKELGLHVTPEQVEAGPTELLRAPARRSQPRYRPLEEASEPPESAGTEPLTFDNGYGGFAADGFEYVLRGGDERPPMPWVNVVANEGFGFLVSESGSASTWSANSRLNRLTPWSNDPIGDPHTEAVYVRDEDARVYWPTAIGPAERRAEVRHGFGYSIWRERRSGLEHTLTTFAAPHDPVKVTWLRLKNESDRPRRLSVFSYQQLVLGDLSSETGAGVETEIDRPSGAILARNRTRADFGERVTFAAAVTPEPRGSLRASADRRRFLGRHGSVARPAAVERDTRLDGGAGRGLDPCAALQVGVTVPAGGEVDCAFLLGEAVDVLAARKIVGRLRQPGALQEMLDQVSAFWTDVTAAVEIETPSRAIDLMVNGWLVYQLLSCRIWGRTAFYQSGGAFGFRDQLQDSAALVYARPDLARAQIVLHAAHQFAEGDVLHWWHPPADRGTRTRCSDDRLWLPYLTAFYGRTTGDWGVLDEPAGYVTARLLEPGEDETYLQATPTGPRDSVYEHCCRAIDASLAVGAHGLPLIGTCDWNDGMNRVGREGRGESVWMAFFLFAVLDGFEPICRQRGDGGRADRYRAHRTALARAVEEHAWDGAWYRRAYYDDGTPLGSAESSECRIDALAQSWAVISGAADPERASRAMDAAESELVAEEAGLIRLLTPPFDRGSEDPGYIKGYVPGIRENGGQYTHGALWVVRALAELGRRDRAAKLLEMLTPVMHGATREDVGVYQVEPYVVAADVYAAPPHVGRGGWTWYTGSAAWMYRVALESVLGFTIAGGREIHVAPRIPDAWPRYAVRYRTADRQTAYEIDVENPNGAAGRVVAVTIDGKLGEVRDGVAVIPLVADRTTHRVTVELGP